MIKLIKFSDKEYSVRTVGATLFNGKWLETRAWLYWTVYIPLDKLNLIHEHFIVMGDNVAWFDDNGNLISMYKAEITK